MTNLQPIEKLIQEVLESAKDATKVVAWYAYPNEVRGPYYRWFTCREVFPDDRSKVATPADDCKFAAAAMNSAETLALALQDALVALRFYGTYSPRQHPEGYYEIHISPGMGGEDRFGTRARETLDRINKMVNK